MRCVRLNGTLMEPYFSHKENAAYSMCALEWNLNGALLVTDAHSSLVRA